MRWPGRNEQEQKNGGGRSQRKGRQKREAPKLAAMVTYALGVPMLRMALAGRYYGMGPRKPFSLGHAWLSARLE